MIFLNEILNVFILKLGRGGGTFHELIILFNSKFECKFIRASRKHLNRFNKLSALGENSNIP